MPVVAVSVKRMNQLLHHEYEMDRLVAALEQLGCDVEDTATQALYRCPACETPNDKLEQEPAPKRCDFCGYERDEPFEQFATDRVIRLDLLADRPDLFDSGGISRALKGYMGLEQGLSDFSVSKGDVQVDVDPIMNNTDTYRPFIVCAVVTMPLLDQDSLREIMRLQENLHWGIGRDRKLASIGVYDMAVIKPPIKYSVVDPDKFKFCPLGMPGVQMTPRQILEDHPKGKAYAHLMAPYKKYPILIDSKQLVLSMPPIINSDETKCKLGSTRLFIDVTGISRDAVVNSLNTLVSALAELGGTMETVTMNYPDGPQATPNLEPRNIDVNYSAARKWLGLPFTRDEFMGYLRKMRLNVQLKSGDDYTVSYPAFRTDIRHEVDIFADLAIGFEYPNIEPKLVPTMTIGVPRPEEEISSLVRDAMIGLGFNEVMSLQLQSLERQFGKYGMEPSNEHVIVENPKTIEQKVVRSHMMTGLMETFHKNRRKAMPQWIFELGNVVIIDPEKETGTSEYRHLAFGIIGPDAGYAEARMVLDSILAELNLTGEYTPATHPAFCDGRLAEVTGPDGLCARIGEIHPRVLNNFGLAYPVAYCELRLKQVI
ncbi:phenylalanine--tRNA ligase subunit beta [candidate division KSB1 bacterium]|nr:phenylalanine--tRNA ligase subunit beta [candidate division KSB1 bacterium]